MELKKAPKIIFAVIAVLASRPLGLAHASGMVTNYPNPFDSREGATTICYTLKAESEVKANIYDLLGNLVKEYPAMIETAGIKTVIWDGTDQRGTKVSKGGYILALEIKSGAAKIKAVRKIGVIH